MSLADWLEAVRQMAPLGAILALAVYFKHDGRKLDRQVEELRVRLSRLEAVLPEQDEPEVDDEPDIVPPPEPRAELPVARVVSR